MDTFEVDLAGRPRRRRHSPEFKQSVVKECRRPGISIASVAMRHQLNANMLRKWILEAERTGPAISIKTNPVSNAHAEPVVPAFVPVTLSSPSVERDIRIQWQRGGTTLNVAWPASSSHDCAVWLRELLR